MKNNRKQYLKYLCLQYDEKKKEIEVFSNYQSPKFEIRGGKQVGGAENRIIKYMMLKSDVEVIEKTLNEVAGDLYEYLFLNITKGTSFEYLDVPCSRRSFYYLKNKFFKLLDKKVL